LAASHTTHSSTHTPSTTAPHRFIKHPPSNTPHIILAPSFFIHCISYKMAYLICRAPRAFSRVSSISSLAATCLRTTRPAVPLISRALSSATVDSQDTPIDESLLPQPIDRSYETPEVTRARLVYQSRKRGILETDLLLSTFASKHLSTMGEAEMREYDQVGIS